MKRAVILAAEIRKQFASIGRLWKPGRFGPVGQIGPHTTLDPGNSVRIGAEGLMTANLGRWEIRTSPAEPAGDGRAPQYRIVRMPWNATSSEPDIEETVADFITRNVLERDSALFEG